MAGRGLVVEVLGGLRVRVDGVELGRVDARSAEALLVYLACERRAFSRDALAELLWPGRSREQSRAALRSAVHRLRRAIGPHLVTTRDGVGLGPAATTDVAAFEANLRGARHDDALALYAGPFLDGFELPDAPAFDAWQEDERTRLEAAAIAAHHHQLSLALAQRDDAAALRHGYALLAIEPLHEPAQRSVARALARGGRHAAAVAHLEAFRVRLAAELGLPPDPATLGLEAALRGGAPPDADHDASSVTTDPAGAIDGDVTHLAPAAAEPPHGDGVSVVAAPIGRVPTFTGSLVGRADASATLQRLLADADCRWVSVTGAGGVGKTRLAVQVADEARRAFASGVVIVPLAGVRSPEFVLPTLAHGLGLEPRPGTPLAEQLVAFLREKQLLLVLDNLEHVLDAVADVATIVRHAPRVKVLATTRSRLHISEEWLVPLDGLEAEDAVTLFASHVRRLGGAHDLEENRAHVEAIARHLDGLPLAIELAATWVNALSLTDIERSLAAGSDLLRAPRLDLPPRQRSIDDVLRASWDLLTDELRDTFAQLGAFRGGFTVREAEAVTGAGAERLLGLLDRSLIRTAGAQRFELHELARRFAAERLAERADRHAVARRHLAAYADLAEACGRAVFGPDLLTAVARMSAEQDNLRAAMAWALTAPGVERDLLRLIDHTAYVWRLTAATEEAQSWIDQALERPGWTSIDVATLRFHAAHVAWMRGSFEAAAASLQGAIALFERDAPTDAHLPRARCSLGMTLYMQGSLEAAMPHFDAVVAATDDTDPWWSACATGWKGKTAVALGDMDAAQGWLDASVRAFDRLGSAWGAGLFVGTAAELHLARGEVRRARHLADTSIALLEGIGFVHALANVYDVRATIARLDGDEPRARTLLHRSIACYRHLGDVASALAIEGRLEAATG